MNTTKLLSASAILNLVLALFAGFVILHAKATRTPGSRQLPEPKPVPVTESAGQESPHSITWLEIASPDYPVYIDHLRALGCPERTIRSIIASAMTVGNQSMVVSQGPGEQEPEMGLTMDQQSKLQQLLGLSTASVRMEPVAEVSVDAAGVVTYRSSSSSLTTATEDSEEETITPQMPLAFFLKPGSGVELSPEQQTALQSLQKSFTKQVGGANQNVADPAYLNRWVAAQPTLDDIFHAQFGDAAYGQVLLQRANQTGNFQQ